MELYGLSAALLVYVAFAFDVSGFLARDELVLRVLMLAAMVFYILYYLFVTDTPLWEAIMTDSVLMVVNIAMIIIITMERTTLSMNSDRVRLFEKFEMLTPGQFRKLYKFSHYAIAPNEVVLCRQGEAVKRLTYIVEGSATLVKDGARYSMNAGQFVGEIGFLTGDAATGDVTLYAGSEYLSWDVGKLQQTFDKQPALRAAMLAQFNLDLVGKVARGVPLGSISATV
ncbi:MAG: cyclic nucleotide-binding domain-containing protein [Rhodobacteraceae bacterium]|nr:cyclic nucleotide-binding domain-containing protein [Paracoccaceae bacterium]